MLFIAFMAALYNHRLLNIAHKRRLQYFCIHENAHTDYISKH